jgi:GT2 family glycosyltransferase
MKLTIGYSTLAERVSSIRFPSQDYDYLVLIQNPKQVSYQPPKEAQLIEVAGKGVAKSRNQAILNTKTELLIFGDDDVVFHPEELDKAIQKFEQNPDLVMLLLAAKDETGRARKQYPTRENKLTLLNSARAATYEMMIRVKTVKELEVKFDERFGAGAELYLGDEYIFISDLIKAGARCEFAPIFVATHPSDSSGERWGTAVDRKARAAVFDRVFGPTAPLVRLAFGIRRLKLLGGLRQLLVFVVGR